ncbi:MAG TPA: DNA-binding protein [Anaerolineaceae bacterium]|nr:DNA-binding protein [Anaerolineaceae bacterium]
MADIIVISPEDEIYPKDRLATYFPNLPALHTLGNPDLLRLPLTALFCSRKCPGDAILKAYDLARELREKEIPVISGFHTPVEKDMLEILLKGKDPIVICLARRLEGMRIPKGWSQSVQQGHLLLVSMFDQKTHRVTKEAARQRNLLVAALASKCEFIHIEPGGETEKVSKNI